MFEAVKLLFEKNVLPFINKFDQSDVPYILKFDSHDWRVKRLWNEQCDQVYRYYMQAFKAIYEKYSGKYTLPGMPR